MNIPSHIIYLIHVDSTVVSTKKLEKSLLADQKVVISLLVGEAIKQRA